MREIKQQSSSSSKTQGLVGNLFNGKYRQYYKEQLLDIIFYIKLPLIHHLILMDAFVLHNNICLDPKLCTLFFF